MGSSGMDKGGNAGQDDDMTKRETRPLYPQMNGTSEETNAPQNGSASISPVADQKTSALSLLSEQDVERPVIVVRGLSKAFQGRSARIPALRDLSFQVQRGEFVALTGPSGAGKSALLYVLGCLTRPSHGDYWLATRPMSRLTADELANERNRHIGVLFKESILLQDISILDNVALPLLYAGSSGAEKEHRARTLLQCVGLGKHWHLRPAQLSLWQQRRVALARALVNNPFLLLVDEPMSDLDRRGRLEMLAFLQALNQRGLTIVLVAHEAETVLYAKRQIVLHAGRIVQDAAISGRRIAIDELSREGYSGSAQNDVSQREAMSIRIQEELF